MRRLRSDENQGADAALCELCEAVADGPILFRGVENGHENVRRLDTRIFARSSAVRRNSACFCSTVRVLNTVIWMYTTSALG